MADGPRWYENKKKYNIEYTREHYVRVVMDVPPEVKKRLQENAKAAGMSLTAYILDKAL